MRMAKKLVNHSPMYLICLILMFGSNISYTMEEDRSRKNSAVCRMDEVINILSYENPELKEGLTAAYLTRSKIQALENCEVLHGSFRLIQESFYNRNPKEDIREEDLKNVMALKEINGSFIVDFSGTPWACDLQKYLNWFNSSLWFLPNLRVINSSDPFGFVIRHTPLAALNLTGLQVNVRYGEVVDNANLCYINNSTLPNVIVKNNREKKACEKLNRVCASACDPRMGCSGPSDIHCGACRPKWWKARDRCVDHCKSAPGFFAPLNNSTGTCYPCHSECNGTCLGDGNDKCGACKNFKDEGRCVPRCPFHKYAEKNGSCTICAQACLGHNFRKSTTLRRPACTGPAATDCSVSCKEMEYRSAAGDGIIVCHPCSKNCRGGCWKGDSDGCYKCLNWKVINNNQKWFCAPFCVGEEQREKGELICRKCPGLCVVEKVAVTEGVTITAPPTSGQQPSSNVKLLVFFNSRRWIVKSSRPEIEEKGKYWWMGEQHIKCQIKVPVPQDGWVTSNVIRDALAPMFTGRGIQSIFQWRGVSKGREVMLVTSLPDDEVPRKVKERSFCDSDGKEFTEEVKRTRWHRIRSGGKLLIAGGGRRTVVTIWDS